MNKTCFNCMRKTECYTASELNNLKPNETYKDKTGYECGVAFTDYDTMREFIYVIGDAIAKQDHKTQKNIMQFIADRYNLPVYNVMLEFERQDETTTVEVCPYCYSENEYPKWNTNTQGYKTVCQHCGQEIMLCDLCLHAEDNPNQHCDWRKTEDGGKCFRGVTVEKEVQTK